MIQLEEECKATLRTDEPLDSIIEPIRSQARSSANPRGSFANSSGGAEYSIHVLSGRPRGVSKTHDCAADQEQFTFRLRIA